MLLIDVSPYMFFCSIILFVLMMFYKLMHKRKAKNIFLKSGISDIDQMDGRQFEFFLEALFIKLGYKAAVTNGSHDFGADLIFKGKNKIVIQAKRYGFKNKVGIKAIQEIYAAKAFYKANEAWVITNSTYTSSAKQLARACNVKLLDRSSLQEFIVQVNPEQKPADIRKSVKPATRKCPKCGEELVSRTHDGRVFLGCSSFPQCRHTEKVAN
ncbi:restriction endonuclease [Bacillus cereus]|nr:restriction endonuclease [Bacillus thuringiensis]PEX16969.1 restriction endonuclease [Bacillus cereus]PFC35592.1 restriction endonuclease [Bacillus cereus]PFQ72058.1 restriction endonuclease [Bacillus cereus]PFU10159.1 restriction endonuclease [Bacillus cereus]